MTNKKAISRKKINKMEIKKLMINNGLTLTDMIDLVVDVNGIIGVGLIRLGDDLQNYCHDKIKGAK